jgi:uncharacterized protein (DUF433 family)
MTLTDRIEINSQIMLGKPVIRGTRIPIELLLRKLSEGATEADLLDAYPRLSREDSCHPIRSRRACSRRGGIPHRIWKNSGLVSALCSSNQTRQVDSSVSVSSLRSSGRQNILSYE